MGIKRIAVEYLQTTLQIINTILLNKLIIFALKDLKLKFRIDISEKTIGIKTFDAIIQQVTWGLLFNTDFRIT